MCFTGMAALVIGFCLLVPGQTKCILEDNTDHPGGDFNYKPMNTSSECCAWCEEDPKCVLWSFAKSTNPILQNYCFLKSEKRTSNPDPNVISGTKEVPENEKCIIEDNMDYPGGDFSFTQVNNASECCDLCTADPKCVIWSLTKPSHPMVQLRNYCFLKSEKRTGNPDPNIISGTKASETAKCMTEENVHYLNGGYSVAKIVQDASECCDQCADDPTCLVWTYAKPTCPMLQNYCFTSAQKSPAPDDYGCFTAGSKV